jgi:hypothetical protein
MNITLKKSTEKLADFFAHTKTQIMGLNPDEKEYQKHYKRFFNQFCKEAIEHSMTPSGELRANPIAGAVKPQFSFDKVVDKFYKGDTKTEKILKHQVDSAIHSLVSAFMQIRLGVQAKATKEKQSDMVFNEKGSDAMLEVELNRYTAYMVSGFLYGYLENFFSQPLAELPDVFEKALPKDINGEVSLRVLRNKTNRNQFAKLFFQAGKDYKS